MGDGRTMTPTPAWTPAWTIAAPLVALAFAAVEITVLPHPMPGWAIAVAVVLLLAGVFAAVHHAETVAHRVGQPYGAIILALAVTVIEVSLIVSLLLSAPPGESAIARDTVFATIMIVLNGIIGLSLLVGGLRHHEQRLRSPSAVSALGVLGTLSVLALVLPNFTLSRPGPVYSPPELIFVSVVSLALYGFLLHSQMVRHREDFADPADDGHAEAPVDRRAFAWALGLLPLSLLAVVLLGEGLAGPVETAIDGAGLPKALVGVAIAAIVLLPEAIASVKAAHANRLQTAMNLALGSALATLCLTIPAVALISLVMGQNLVLGLAGEHQVLLVLSLFMVTLSLVTGRTTALQGGVHLVIFGAFLTMTAAG
jgi:Ca2+:H+ antiporter